MQLFPLRSELVLPGDSITERFITAAYSAKVGPRNGDIVAVASKVVAVAEKRVVKLSNVNPSRKALSLGKTLSMSSRMAQLVIDESDRVYGGVKGAMLTVKNGIATANAGVDQKNAPDGYALLWPRNPEGSARRLRISLQRKFQKTLGVVIVDSRVTPLRLGTIGLALSTAGFEPIRDFRGEPDLYGRRPRITFQAVADDIASASHLLMGEAGESTPFVVARDVPVRFDGHPGSEKLKARDCLFMSQL